MTLEMKHRKTAAQITLCNDDYQGTGKMQVSGDAFLVDYFEAYFNRQLTTHWGNADGIPDKFINGERIEKHTDAFLLEYFMPLYANVYDMVVG